MVVAGLAREHILPRWHSSAWVRCRWLFVLALAFPAVSYAAPAPRPAILYHVAPGFVTLRFVVRSMLDLFTVTGDFKHFSGDLLLDFDAPAHSHVDVTVASASIDTGWDTANKIVRSAAYLDPARYPTVHFVSDRIVELAPDHVTLHGQLTVRGVTRPEELDARLEDYRNEPGVGPVADFVVTGQFNRGDFGLTADYPLVSMQVSLQINAHIRLTPVKP